VGREEGRFRRAGLTQRAKRRGTLITDVFCGHRFFYSFFSFFFVFRGHGFDVSFWPLGSCCCVVRTSLTSRLVSGGFFFRRELYFVADVIKASVASCKVLRFIT